MTSTPRLPKNKGAACLCACTLARPSNETQRCSAIGSCSFKRSLTWWKILSPTPSRAEALLTIALFLDYQEATAEHPATWRLGVRDNGSGVSEPIQQRALAGFLHKPAPKSADDSASESNKDDAARPCRDRRVPRLGFDSCIGGCPSLWRGVGFDQRARAIFCRAGLARYHPRLRLRVFVSKCFVNKCFVRFL